MLYRLVNENEYSTCREMIKDAGLSTISPSLYPRELSNYYFNKDMETFKVFCAVNDSGISAIVFVEFMSHSRSWIIRYMVKHHSVIVTDIVHILDFISDYAIKCGYHTCYAVYFDKKYKLIEEMIKDNTSVFDRYTVNTETVIPYNMKSSFLSYWEAFQKYTMYNNEITVRQYSLHEKYRIWE